jgi:hypothetical protein
MQTVSGQFKLEQGRCRQEYSLELARRTSHISSMLSSESLLAELLSTVQSFTAYYGSTDLRHFLVLLTQGLEARGRPEAVKLILHYLEYGQLDLAEASKQLAVKGQSMWAAQR